MKALLPFENSGETWNIENKLDIEPIYVFPHGERSKILWGK
ncbi:hypothetical protein [Tissierella carlieri]|nr:hypothetical protein [Tissierella carlieri]